MYLDEKLILDRISENDLVLDIGGWDKVFPRADFVLDIMPYDTRRNLTGAQEHFTRDTWIQADVQDLRIWEKFQDKQFDFLIASHILEDIRDPIGLLSQIVRVAKAGYIEVPCVFREVSKLSSEEAVTGYDHHRWLIWVDTDESKLCLKPKLGWAWVGDRVSGTNRHLLSDYHYQFDGIFWNESINFKEIIPKGWIVEDNWLSDLVEKTIDGPKPRQHIFHI